MGQLVNPELATAIFAVIAFMLYGMTLSHILPKHRHFMVNISFTLLAVALGFLAGLSKDDIGLSPQNLLHGLPVILGLGLVILIGTIVGTRLAVIRAAMKGESWFSATRRQLIYAIGIRIPLSTVLLEEVLFRGIMLGLLLQVFVPVWALLISSLLFGLWHISPAVAQLESNESMATNLQKPHKQLFILTTVLTTSFAGLAFGGLRLWTGSLLAPWLIHWAINASGVVASSLARREN